MNIAAIGCSFEEIILSCGGTLITRIKNGDSINLIIPHSKNILNKKYNIQKLNDKYGMKSSIIDEFNCSQVTQSNVKLIQEIFEKNHPDTIIIPFNKSRKKENKILGQSSILAGRQIKNILMYEINKNNDFTPTVFQDTEKVNKIKKEILYSLDETRKNELKEKMDDINKKNKKHGLEMNLFEPLQSFRLVLN